MVPDEVYVITIVPGRQFALSAAPISARDIEQQFPHFDVNLNSGEPRGSDSSLVSRATASSSGQPARRTSCCGHPGLAGGVASATFPDPEESFPDEPI